MFLDYFGIDEDPFSVTPDPKYTFLSERHRDALAHLMYGVTQEGGFVQLTGEVGTGKTTLCRKLLSQLPVQTDLALIFNPLLTPIELVASLCDELGVAYPPECQSIKILVDRLNRHLLERFAEGRQTVVLIDEAQNLSRESMEQLRLLTNLETATHKLLKIILVGQPELKELLARSELRQLAQRITARFHLTPLIPKETVDYVRHRLSVVGIERALFTPGALRLLFKYTGGVPRLLNVYCGRCMLAAYAGQEPVIDSRLLRRVDKEIQDIEKQPWGGWVWIWSTLAGLTLAALLLGFGILRPLGLLQEIEQRASAYLSTPVTQIPTPATASAPVPKPLPAENPATDAQAETVEDAPSLTMLIQSNAHTSKMNPASSTATSLRFQPMLTQQELIGLMNQAENAFTTLFAYWQEVFTPSQATTACDYAKSVGLSCIFGRGTWVNLAFYNQPAVLELVLADGHRFHVALTALDKTSAQFDLGFRTVTLPRDELDELWNGSYIILWRPPELFSKVLNIGQEGPDIAWLKSMLDRADGLTPDAANDASEPIYDLALKQRVVDFQRAAGLRADGLVGRYTQLKLIIAAHMPDTPVLTKGQE